MAWFMLLTGGAGLVALVLFILAVRLSYRIEARSPTLQNRSGVPRNAMLFHTIGNVGVARDAPTQAMRRRMLMLLGGALAVFSILLLTVLFGLPP